VTVIDAVADTGPAIALAHVFDYAARLKPPVVVGRTAAGTRMYYEAVGGRIIGPSVNGDILTGGGDWAVVGDDGWVRVDVRGQSRTDDGAVLYMSYRGLIEPSAAFTSAVMSGGETSYDDQYWRVAIEVETGDPRYAWLTSSVLIGRGRLMGAGRVGYQVFRVG
jgi:hypothetical protein